MANLAEILEAAMSLDVHDRAALAEKLLSSIERLTEKEVERLWLEEAHYRLGEFRAGQADAINSEAVHTKAEQFFQNC